jgi:hypothetical protein
MADYTVYYSAISAPTEFTGELPLTSFSWSEILNAPGAISGAFPLDPYPTLATLSPLNQETFLEGGTILWVYRDRVPVWSGLLWSWQASVDADLVSFTGEGWHSYLRRLPFLLQSGTFTATDQAVIANYFVDYAAFNGGVPLVTNGSASHGVARDRTYFWWEAKPVAEIIDQLAAVQNGFDFRYVTRPDRTILFETLYPATGVTTDHVFELGVNCAVVDYSSDGKTLANYVVAFGSGQGSGALFTAALNSAAVGTYPLLTEVRSWPDVTSPTTLQGHADRDLQRHSTPTRLLDLEIFPDTQPAVGSFSVGDRCKVTATRGFLQLDRVDYRITALNVDVDESGTETVRVSLAPLRMFTE